MQKRYASLNTTHPFRSNPDGRAKHWSRIAGNGRSYGRLQGPLTPTPGQVQPRANPSPNGAKVGDRVHGNFWCPSCRANVDTLVRQSAASPRPWVCAAWCSPRNPRTEHFVSAAPRPTTTEAVGHVYTTIQGHTHKPCGVPGCSTLVDIHWGEPVGHIGMLVFATNHNYGKKMANGHRDERNPLCFPKMKKVTMCAAHMAELDIVRATTAEGRTPFIAVQEL